ncbi:hypothetical protein [Pelagibius sp. Alg239-R121]|uniref:hypothetical protein n=1 Tax=Pelagibius sp. Alg239-R121 TaxID=2993448 RepID=UPI0024A74896|nr:hypothetical protein [Pelagibius sp. Alg239-R121]
MFDEISAKIAQALKRSKVLIRVKGQDPDTGYRVAAKYIAEELERSYEIRRRRMNGGYKVPGNE